LIAYTISQLGPECLGTPLQYAVFMIDNQEILADLFLTRDLSWSKGSKLHDEARRED
jgi:hypothetical protein